MPQTDPDAQQADDAPRKSTAARIAPILVVVLLVAVAFALVSRPTAGRKTTSDTSVSVIIGNGRGDAKAQYPIALQEGGDPAHESDHVFESLQGLEGVAVATLDWSTGAVVLTVSLDQEKISASEIANALAGSGYLAAPTQ